MLYTLRSRLVATFVLLLVLPFVTMMLILSQVSNSVIGVSIIKSTAHTMDQYTGFVNTLTTQVDDVANQILSNDLTQEWISAQLDPDLLTSKKVTLDADLRKYLSSIALNNTVISSITVFDHKGSAVGIRDQIFRDSAYMESDWYKRFMIDNRRWVSTHLDSYQPIYLQGDNVNSLLFPMVLLENFKEVGVMKINFLSSTIQEPLDQIKFGKTGRLYILDIEGLPVFKQQDFTKSDPLNESISRVWNDKRSGGEIHFEKDDVEHVMFFRKLKAHWLLIGEVPEKELYQTVTNVRNTMLLISGILLFLTIISAYWLSSGIAKPLSKLAFAMRYVERGDFNRAEEALHKYAKIKNEVGFVTTVFHGMVNRLRFLIETEYIANMRRKDAEFKALLMQINPHFLYNTLEIIGGLSAQGRNDEVIDVTESLGRMLRFSLRLDTELVKLKEEIQYLRYYISIMEVRFGDRLKIDIHEQFDVKEAMIVKFMLQPLVENAIKYSLEYARIAEITISSERFNDQLHIHVADNGMGMSEELILEILEPMDASDFSDVLSTKGERIGMRNVLTRCQLIYGDQFQVDIHSSPGKGTLISMTIPFRTGE